MVMVQVLAVAPVIGEVPLNKAQVLEVTVSASKSLSCQAPLLQVRRLPTLAVPVIVGGEMEAS